MELGVGDTHTIGSSAGQGQDLEIKGFSVVDPNSIISSIGEGMLRNAAGGHRSQDSFQLDRMGSADRFEDFLMI